MVGEPHEWHDQAVTAVAYSPDGLHIISGSQDGTIRIWDAKTGAAVGKPLKGHDRDVTSVAYSPDGQHIISGSGDWYIRIWDAKTGAAVGKPLEGHNQAVTSVVYSPDGRHIISGSNDRTIRVWDAKAGAAVGNPLEEFIVFGRILLLTLLMGSTSFLDLATAPFESGMLRPVLRLASVWGGMIGEVTEHCILSRWAAHHLWI
jgi:WD40 repeat protein